MSRHLEHKPDVSRSAYPTQRLQSGMQVLGVLGVGDEHCRPLLEPQVGEAQQVVVEGQNPVPADECETDKVTLKSFQDSDVSDLNSPKPGLNSL